MDESSVKSDAANLPVDVPAKSKTARIRSAKQATSTTTARTTASSKAKPALVRNSASKIMKAAMNLFSKHSFDAVSMQQVADRAGVSKATIFHHFKNKEALFIAIISNYIAPQAEYAEKLYPQPISSAEKIWLLLFFCLSEINNRRIQTLTKLVESALERDSKSAHFKLCTQSGNEIFCRNINAVDALFRQGQEIGEFRQDIYFQTASLVFFSLIHFYSRRHNIIRKISPRQPFSEFEFAKDCYLVIISGILAPQHGDYFIPQHPDITNPKKPT